MTANTVRRLRAGAPQNVDGRIPHRDWPEAGETQQADLEQDDEPGLPFAWLPFGGAVVLCLALLGYYGSDIVALFVVVMP